MKRSFISWLIEERTQLALSVAALAGMASCMAQPMTSEQIAQTEKGEKVGVVSAALGPAPATYVVNANGGDGYCDGVVYVGDHAAAIQACIDKAFANGGGTVLVTPGTYNTQGGAWFWTVNLKANVALRGQDRGTIFAPSQSNTIVGIVGPNTNVSDISFSLGNNSYIGITFTTASAENVTLENNQFDVTGTVSAVSYTGILGNVPGQGYNYLSILRNRFNQGAFNSTTITPISLIGSGWGIRVDGNNATVRNASSPPFLTISGTLTKSVVSGNHFDTYGGNLPDGIRITQPMDVLISNNVIRANNPIVFTGSPLCTAYIMGNTMTGKPNVGDCLTASIGNSENGVIGTTGASPGKPGVLVRAHRSGNQTFTGGSDTVLVFNVETADFGGNYNTSTGQFTAPLAGHYRVRACARFDGTNFVLGNLGKIELYRSGSPNALAISHAIGGPSGFTNCAEDIVLLAQGETLTASAGGTGVANTRTISGIVDYSTYLNIEQVSAQ